MIQIIPAIDIIGGKCVRLTQGDFTRSREYGDPLEMARQFEDHGLKRLHLVDLDGAREKKVVNYGILEKIALRTTLVIDAGGGLRSDEDVRIVMESGARMVTGGSVAVKDPPVFLGWVRRYGPGRVILGADFKEGRIAVSGWEEETSLDLMDYLSGYVEKGIRMAICTDISRDGMLQGPSMEVYRGIKNEISSLVLVASGGIAGLKDVERLQEAGIDGVIIGKALYEKKITLDAIERFIVKNS
ncbi:MAG: 1-(5-phosphoribosyl)-5-[(5-phosphoribosylamino)methylideneamino]imidazole-4-carboxamide isomerase [Bacteroidales bacterium]